MTRCIAIAIVALAVLAGPASAFPGLRIASNSTHLDGLRAGISAAAVDAIVLPTGTTVTVR